jgi:hypothetical protein
MAKETKPPPEPLDLTALAQDATAAYRGLVDRQARGDPIDQAHLREVLTLAGKGLDTFKADSDLLHNRYCAAEALAAAEALGSEVSQARQLLADAEAERDAFYKEFAARKIVLNNQCFQAGENHGRLDGELRRAKATAADVLVKTADPAIAAQTKALQGEARRGIRDALVRKRREPLPELAEGSKGPTVPEVDRVALAEKSKAAAGEKLQATGARAMLPLEGMAWAD